MNAFDHITVESTAVIAQDAHTQEVGAWGNAHRFAALGVQRLTDQQTTQKGAMAIAIQTDQGIGKAVNGKLLIIWPTALTLSIACKIGLPQKMGGRVGAEKCGHQWIKGHTTIDQGNADPGAIQILLLQ